ncbi:hypothetical protein B9Z55_008886 [Caenorhabditis nigoni]|uniref:Peptidase A2 domain-containing protein n=1 Tax=Caenorhabditis nigoni TaxID=1611254 RepID=A0A2G5UPQ6_9PELO|nr:hypothetical protein B9Z55_008886 [Caenorhabditis nigoni]
MLQRRNHPRKNLLIALKTIRIAQYAMREKWKLTEEDETELQLLEEPYVFMFDKLQARDEDGRDRRSQEQEYPLIGINAVRVNSVKAAKLPHIDVNVGGQLLRALVDTGAAVSYIPISSVNSDINTKKKQPKAQAANGSSIHFLGTTDTVIEIGNLAIPHTLLVSLDFDCPAPFLIG